MSANTFTPGPWLVGPVNARVEVPDRDAPICALLWPTDLRSEGETFANARLIAAAPDTTEALQGLLDLYVQLVGCGDCGTWDAEKVPEVIAARAALSKALGQDGESAS